MSPVERDSFFLDQNANDFERNFLLVFNDTKTSVSKAEITLCSGVSGQFELNKWNGNRTGEIIVLNLKMKKLNKLATFQFNIFTLSSHI